MVATKKPVAPAAAVTTQLNDYDREMAEAAVSQAEQETSAASGQFISFQGGDITVDKTKMPNNEMAIIILDGIFENIDYEKGFDANVLASPRCFAFGRVVDEMSHHEMSTNPQCEGLCSECPQNKWKSADNKKGKHCREIRRVAFIPAGQFVNGAFEAIEDPQHFETAEIRYMKVPVTSVKAYSGYVKSVTKSLVPAKPMHGVITRVWTEKGGKNQFQVEFELLDYVSPEIWPILKNRHLEAVEAIEFPYEPMESDEAPEPVQPQRRATPVAPGKGAAAPAKKPLPRARY